MAKNKNNSFKSNNAGNSKNTATTSTSSSSKGGSMKDTHSQVPDKGSSRSGPGGE